MAGGALQADGTTRPEPRMDVADVARAVRYMADLPLDANVATMRRSTNSKRTNRTGKFLANGDCGSQARARPDPGPGLSCWFGVEPPAGIEPATPSLP
jgi:hypothetical protein